MGIIILKRKMAADGFKLKLSLSLADRFGVTYLDISYLKNVTALKVWHRL